MLKRVLSILVLLSAGFLLGVQASIASDVIVTVGINNAVFGGPCGLSGGNCNEAVNGSFVFDVNTYDVLSASLNATGSYVDNFSIFAGNYFYPGGGQLNRGPGAFLLGFMNPANVEELGLTFPNPLPGSTNPFPSPSTTGNLVLNEGYLSCSILLCGGSGYAFGELPSSLTGANTFTVTTDYNTPTPEPSSLWLLVLAVVAAALDLLRRR